MAVTIQIGIPDTGRRAVGRTGHTAHRARRRVAGLVGPALGAAFVLCWSSGFIGAKLGAADAPVTTVLVWRFLPLAVLLLPFWLRMVSGPQRLAPRSLSRQAVIALLSQSGYLLTVYWAIGLGVNAGTTALIDGIQPLVAATLVGPLLGLRVTGRQWVGLVLGLLGASAVTAADAAGGEVAWWAYLVPFAGMLSLVAATFVERRAPAPLPPLDGLALHCAVSAVVFTLLGLATGTVVPPATVSFWVAMAWLVVLSTFGGYGLYWLLLGRLGVTRVNTLMFLMAPVTAVWGAAMFGESFTAGTALGLALGLAAVWIVSRDRDVSRNEADSPGVRGSLGRGGRLAAWIRLLVSRAPRSWPSDSSAPGTSPTTRSPRSASSR